MPIAIEAHIWIWCHFVGWLQFCILSLSPSIFHQIFINFYYMKLILINPIHSCCSLRRIFIFWYRYSFAFLNGLLLLFHFFLFFSWQFPTFIQCLLVISHTPHFSLLPLPLVEVFLLNKCPPPLMFSFVSDSEFIATSECGWEVLYWSINNLPSWKHSKTVAKKTPLLVLEALLIQMSLMSHKMFWRLSCKKA